MTVEVKTFNCPIIDQFGRIDGAFVAVYGVSASAQRTDRAVTTTYGYQLKHNVEAISYNVNYWYNQQARAEGYPSRQLKVDEGSGITDLLLVDLNHPDIINILNSNLEPLDCDLACAESDLIRRFT